MPLDVNCPKCAHVFPVAEARHPFGVQCPACDVELTAEFHKLPVPVPGQPHYELLVTLGKPPGVNPAPQGGGKKLALDDDDEEGAGKRKGGSMAVVFAVGIGALLVTLGGLGATGYVLFTNMDTDDTPGYASSSRGNSSGRPNTNSKGNPTPKVNPPPGDPWGGGGPGTPIPPPKKKVDKFDYRPVAGTVPPFGPPPNLPADNASLELDLGGRVGAVTTAGGGRYVVVHIPDRGLLGVYDAAKGQMVAAGDTDRGEVKIAGGLNRVVTVAEVEGKKKMRSFSLPTMRQEFETTLDMFFGPRGVALGSRTNGPALVWDPFGELFLYDLTPSGAKEVEGARKKLNPGIHSGGGKAFPDGTGFVTYDSHHNSSVRVLSYDSGRRDWKTENSRSATFPSADGFIYGKAVVNDRAGRDARFTGLSTNPGWLVPAVTGGNYFLKLAPTAVAPKGGRRTLAVTFHANRNAALPLPGAPTITGTTELGAFNSFDGNFPDHIPADQHFFLIPEAKSLVILNHDRTKFILRKVDLK